MNDPLDQRLRDHFARIEQDAPPSQPMPVRTAAVPAAHGRPAIRVALVCAAFAVLVAGLVVVRTHSTSSTTVPTAPALQTAPVGIDPSLPSAVTASPSSSTPGSSTPDTSTAGSFPAADPSAKNYLVVGADNNACVDANSSVPVGDRTSLGERSDTIMIVRVEPATNHVSILSLPRDLWVKISGTNGENRINSAYVENDPQVLVNTIYQNFFIPIDHYIQVDFCAFKTLVDAIGGVKVPFATPVRDTHTGLAVTTAGCRNLDGDEALAYVRSRHYQTLGTDGQYHEDPSSDLGRIARQQDFVWRMLSAALANGLSDPVGATELIGVVQANIVVDRDLTLDTMLGLAGVARHIDPATIVTAQLPTHGTVIAGAAVQVPVLDSDAAKTMLALFQGKQPPPFPPTTGTDGAASSTSVGPGSFPEPGIVPDRSVQC
ncbi:MAG: putative LytR family regulatory protein [Acidimicrobiales bacterium]|nr:putative LytR family regulatory protein [Acidimicrobiales bacterium]